MLNQSRSQLPGRLRRRVGQAPLVVPSVVLLLGLIIAPLAALGVFSLYQQVHPLLGFGLTQYRQLFSGTLYLSVLLKTLYVALLVTGVSLLLAWPAGWTVSRLPRRWQITVLTVVILPYLTSFILLIYAMFVLLAPDGPLMTVLSLSGLISKHSSIIYTPWATVVMLIYESIPVVLLVMFAASQRIPDELIEAARSLGARRWQVFRRIIWPISLPSAISGAALVFIPALGVFAEPEILGGPNGLLFGNLINDQINTTGNDPFAAALSFLLLALVMVVVLALGLALRFTRRATRPRAPAEPGGVPRPEQIDVAVRALEMRP